jgi:hypothetical protein
VDLDEALKIASQVTHPVSVVAVALVVALAFWYVLHARKSSEVRLLGTILTVGIILLGLAPLAASTISQLRGIYRVRVIVLGSDHLPVNDARVTSSIGGEPKRIEGGWEFDIPPQSIPEERKVVFYASIKNAFLSGTSALPLGRDYYPTTTIQLASDTSAVLRGVVLDERRRPVSDATVTIEGYPDQARTDSSGNFVLPAHAADAQIVEVRAQKGQLLGNMSVPAGKEPVEIILKRP